jgi:cadmium resistance protein CadD (predicted permease)
MFDSFLTKYSTYLLKKARRTNPSIYKGTFWGSLMLFTVSLVFAFYGKFSSSYYVGFLGCLVPLTAISYAISKEAKQSNLR